MSVVRSAIMGKEQDLLVAVKSGDLLLAHKLLSKVKCNKTSEYGANSGREIYSFVLLSNFVFVLCSGPGSVIVSTVTKLRLQSQSYCRGRCRRYFLTKCSFPCDNHRIIAVDHKHSPLQQSGQAQFETKWIQTAGQLQLIS